MAACWKSIVQKEKDLKILKASDFLLELFDKPSLCVDSGILASNNTVVFYQSLQWHYFRYRGLGES